MDVQLAEKNDQAEALGSEVNVLKGRLDDLTKTLHDSEQNSDIEAELNKRIANEEALKSNVAELEAAEAKRVQEGQTLTGQLDEANATIAAQAIESKDSSNREAELKAKLAELEATETERVREVQELTGQLNAAKATIETQAAESVDSSSREAELSLQLEQVAALESATAKLTQEKQDLSDELDQANASIADNAVANSDRSSREQELKTQMDEAGKEIAEKDG